MSEEVPMSKEPQKVVLFSVPTDATDDELDAMADDLVDALIVGTPWEGKV